MKFLLFSLFYFIALITLLVINAEDLIKLKDDYCHEKYQKYCMPNTKHVACNITNLGYGTYCPKGPDGKPLARLFTSEEIQGNFTYFHNWCRNKLASGSETGFKPAKRMATIEWDEELATFAKVNILSCKNDHDQCRGTAEFHQPGQNMAGMSWTSGASYSTEHLVNISVMMWYSELTKANMSHVDSFPDDNTTWQEIGHISVLALDRVTKIGCAMLTMLDPEAENVIVMNAACNYASIFMSNNPIYKSGTKGGEGCEKQNEDFPALCSTEEKFSPSWW